MSGKQRQLNDLLSVFWDQNVLEIAGDVGDSCIDVPLVPLDSITACDALIDIERIVGQKLPVEKIVRKGGYSSKDDFIEDVTKAVTEFLGATP